MSEPTDAFQTYQSKTGGILDAATSLLKINSTQYSNLQPLTFNIGDESYDLTPDGQIWPRTLNTFIGGSSSSIYLIVGDIGSPSGSGYDFVNGFTFLYVLHLLFLPRPYIRLLSASATIAYMILPMDKSVLLALHTPNRHLTKSHRSFIANHPMLWCVWCTYSLLSSHYCIIPRYPVDSVPTSIDQAAR